jgi:hypothetical protein
MFSHLIDIPESMSQKIVVVPYVVDSSQDLSQMPGSEGI